MATHRQLSVKIEWVTPGKTLEDKYITQSRDINLKNELGIYREDSAIVLDVDGVQYEIINLLNPDAIASKEKTIEGYSTQIFWSQMYNVYMVKDCGSLTGTTVNNVRLAPFVQTTVPEILRGRVPQEIYEAEVLETVASKPVQILAGDRIRLGERSSLAFSSIGILVKSITTP